MTEKLSAQLSAKLSAEKPLYNAIILHGYTYELITDFKEPQPCNACEINAICHALNYEPGICSMFDGMWNQYFKRRTDE